MVKVINETSIIYNSKDFFITRHRITKAKNMEFIIIMKNVLKKFNFLGFHITHLFRQSEFLGFKKVLVSIECGNNDVFNVNRYLRRFSEKFVQLHGLNKNLKIKTI